MRATKIKWQKWGIYLLFLFIIAILSFQARAATQSDAIAVRVLPNINHDSIDVWYKNQGYKGSPQSLTVDGYEAIRDGRTVFVNAANLDTVNKKLYTNVYLISYNQDSEVKTLDVLGQLISHWKFNNNINTTGSCSISNFNCSADTDCPSGYICSNSNSMGSDHSSASNKGKCILEKGKTCLLDSDCPVNLFCDSLKARTIRDVRRLGDMNQLKEAIERFKNNNNTYPTLLTGTYLSGGTLSVWPSWKDTLSTQLGLNKIISDPINSLGYCEGYDPKTCWDETKKSFVNSDLVLPYGSYALAYKSSPNGISYSLCSTFETKDLGYDTAGGRFAKENCLESIFYSGNVSNTAPKVIGSFTQGQTSKEFNGYIRAIDAEGDSISWNLGVTSPSSWVNSGWQVGPNLIPTLRDTDNPNQKQIYHPTTGRAGKYEMLLTLTDSRGAVSTSTIILDISAVAKPRIEADNADYFVDPINPLKYTFYLEGENSVPTYNITPANPSHASAKLADFATMTSSQTSVGLNRVRVDLSFNVLTSVNIPDNISIPFKITATAAGVSSTKEVTINFRIEKPLLNFDCDLLARKGKSYPLNGNCFLGRTKSGNLNINYSVSGANGISVQYGGQDSSGSKDAFLRGLISDTGTKNITVRAENDYGAFSEKTFPLTVNTFCGDGILQRPNSEGRGGLYNDGMEECDIKAGVTDKISTSSALQYACNSGSNTPFPIVDNNSCIFKPADKGGGFCGDGVCQFKIEGGVMMENCWNCSQDCGQCLATIISKADDEHATYLNSEPLYSGTQGATQRMLVPGKNIFTFAAYNSQDNDYGVAFKIKIGPTSAKLNADGFDSSHGFFDIENSFAQIDSSSGLLKCVALKDEEAKTNFQSDGSYNWTQLGYSKLWPEAKVNTKKLSFLGSPYIWAADGNGKSENIWCRLVFDYSNYNTEVCQPDCSGKKCGSDGCGGICGTCSDDKDCSSDGKCLSKCVPNCVGKCGGDDGCGGTCKSFCILPLTCGGSGIANVCGLASENTNNQTCAPDCVGKCGGPDGCGGTCANTCCSGYACSNSVKCNPVASGVETERTGMCYSNSDCPSDSCYDNLCRSDGLTESTKCCIGVCKPSSLDTGGVGGGSGNYRSYYENDSLERN